MTPKFIARVIEQKRAEIATKSARLPLEALRAQTDGASVRDFAAALRGGERIIAEVKKKSPNVDRFPQAADPVRLASVYEASGAAAISVVTDTLNFGTSLGDAQRIRETVSLPVLVKDFFLDAYQVYEARAFGADAVLLIARILDERGLARMLDVVRELGLHALVEVHDDTDLAKAKAAGALVMGINNRDLDTMTVSLDTTRRLVNATEGDAIVLSESGIGRREDIVELTTLGVDAFLIGGALLQSPDPGLLLGELLGHAAVSGRTIAGDGDGRDRTRHHDGADEPSAREAG